MPARIGGASSFRNPLADRAFPLSALRNLRGCPCRLFWFPGRGFFLTPRPKHARQSSFSSGAHPSPAVRQRAFFLTRIVRLGINAGGVAAVTPEARPYCRGAGFSLTEGKRGRLRDWADMLKDW